MRRIYRAFMIAIVLLTAGCVTKQEAYQEKMHTLSSALTKLSSSVEATVRYDNPDQNISDEELLELSTEHDKSLREPFRDYKVKILHQNKHAIVLVCTEDGEKALLEDAGCTAEMDSNRWMPQELPTCSATLSDDVCER